MRDYPLYDLFSDLYFIRRLKDNETGELDLTILAVNNKPVTDKDANLSPGLLKDIATICNDGGYFYYIEAKSETDSRFFLPEHMVCKMESEINCEITFKGESVREFPLTGLPLKDISTTYTGDTITIILRTAQEEECHLTLRGEYKSGRVTVDSKEFGSHSFRFKPKIEDTNLEHITHIIDVEYDKREDTFIINDIDGDDSEEDELDEEIVKEIRGLIPNTIEKRLWKVVVVQTTKQNIIIAVVPDGTSMTSGTIMYEIIDADNINCGESIFCGKELHGIEIIEKRAGDEIIVRLSTNTRDLDIGCWSQWGPGSPDPYDETQNKCKLLLKSIQKTRTYDMQNNGIEYRSYTD